jgi:hypothetical protein
MVRTGMRLSEQAALSLFEVPPDRGLGGYQRFWLPLAIAKGGSARWIYVPASVVADLLSYAEIDRGRSSTRLARRAAVKITNCGWSTRAAQAAHRRTRRGAHRPSRWNRSPPTRPGPLVTAPEAVAYDLADEVTGGPASAPESGTPA